MRLYLVAVFTVVRICKFSDPHIFLLSDTCHLAPAESDEQLARIRAIAMKIFDAQQLLTVATTMMADLDLITANDNQILDWQLEYLEKHARTARENLSSMSGVRPVFPPQIDD